MAVAVGFRRVALVLALVASSLAVAGPARALDPSGACLIYGGTGNTWSAGSASDWRTFLRPSGERKAAMLFVDFAEAPGDLPVTTYWERLGPPAEAFAQEVSYGRLNLDIVPHLKWVRMPQPASYYASREPGQLLRGAVQAADADFNFAGFDLVYVAATDGSSYEKALAYTGENIGADGNVINHGATFGGDAWDWPYRSRAINHETAHTFGLPDTYATGGAPDRMGGWDIMTTLSAPGAHHLAWFKWKLGWLDAGQTACVTQAGTTTHEITPVATAGGLEFVAIRTGQRTAIVVENRQRLGADSGICEDGALVYKVDSGTDDSPVRVQPAQSDGDQVPTCHNFYEAPFDVGEGEVSTYTDPAAGVTIEVLSKSSNGTLTVQVTRQTDLTLPDEVHARSIVGTGFSVTNNVLTLKGFLSVKPAYGKCVRGVITRLQAYRSGRWVTLSKDTTDTKAVFILKGGFRPGKYRVQAPKKVIDGFPRHVCKAASTTLNL